MNYPNESQMYDRYRETCIYLWKLIISYASCSRENIGQILEVFERSTHLTQELERSEIDINVSSFLERIVDEIPNLRRHLEELTVAVLNDYQTDALVEQDLINPHNSVQHDGNFSRRENSNNEANKNSDEARDAERKLAIQATKEYPADGGLETVAGLAEAKQVICEAVILPTRFPQHFTGGRSPWNRLLMYGPPGTGKTKLARAVASQINAAFYTISSSDLTSVWVGESEKLIRQLFQTVRCSEKVVIFIDEIDGICRKRSSTEDDHTRRLKTELLSQMEKLDKDIFMLAATNCPWDVDSAFLRRFQRRVYIPLPEKEARLEIIKFQTDGCKVSLSEVEWEALIDHTDGYSGSDLTDLTKSALFEPIRELGKATHWTVGLGGMWSPVSSSHPTAIKCTFMNVLPSKVMFRDVNASDFARAIMNTPRTVSAEEIKAYKEFGRNTK